MSQFSTHNPYQMGKEAYADGLGVDACPSALPIEQRKEFRRGWIAARNETSKEAGYNTAMSEVFNIMFGGSDELVR
jgi:hypothetical protein